VLVAKIVSIYSCDPSFSVILGVCAAVSARRGIWGVWLKLPLDKALESSLGEVKAGISEGSVGLKSLLSGGVDVGKLMGLLGGFVIWHLLEVAKGRKVMSDRMGACADSVR